MLVQLYTILKGIKTKSSDQAEDLTMFGFKQSLEEVVYLVPVFNGLGGSLSVLNLKDNLPPTYIIR